MLREIVINSIVQEYGGRVCATPKTICIEYILNRIRFFAIDIIDVLQRLIRIVYVRWFPGARCRFASLLFQTTIIVHNEYALLGRVLVLAAIDEIDVLRFRPLAGSLAKFTEQFVLALVAVRQNALGHAANVVEAVT